jgi:hypothetical protein
MTYKIITMVLTDGRRIERIPYCTGRIDLTGLPGFWKVPFSEQDIASVAVTHDKSGHRGLRIERLSWDPSRLLSGCIIGSPGEALSRGSAFGSGRRASDHPFLPGAAARS